MNQPKIINTFETKWEAFEERRHNHNSNLFNQTNKLILKIDQLINQSTKSPDEPVVDWTSVKLCPFCAKSFNLTRRRHHCLVCGAVQCENCSRFLSYNAAIQLVKPVRLYSDPYDRIEDRLERKSAENIPSIRTCQDCKRILDQRIQIIEDHYSQPLFLAIYEKLRMKMTDADKLIILQSNQQEVKAKIQDFREDVVKISSKIRELSLKEMSDKQAYLLTAITQSVAYWLKESLDSKINRVKSEVGGSAGWVPEQPTSSGFRTVDEKENPLLTQIKNLEEYIRQAKSAGRYEEVESLTANKRDLEIEYYIQQDMNSLSNIEEPRDPPDGDTSLDQ